jgi:hypothetical protein
MRRKRERRRLAPERAGACESSPDHRAMAAMYAVKIADRYHTAFQQADVADVRAHARDVKF